MMQDYEGNFDDRADAFAAEAEDQGREKLGLPQKAQPEDLVKCGRCGTRMKFASFDKHCKKYPGHNGLGIYQIVRRAA